MNGKQIIVKVRPDGSIQIEAEGYSGPGCVEAVRHYAELLGLTVEEENKPEFYLAGTEEGTGLTLGGEL